MFPGRSRRRHRCPRRSNTTRKLRGSTGKNCTEKNTGSEMRMPPPENTDPASPARRRRPQLLRTSPRSMNRSTRAFPFEAGYLFSCPFYSGTLIRRPARRDQHHLVSALVKFHECLPDNLYVSLMTSLTPQRRTLSPPAGKMVQRRNGWGLRQPEMRVQDVSSGGPTTQSVQEQ